MTVSFRGSTVMESRLGIPSLRLGFGQALRSTITIGWPLSPKGKLESEHPIGKLTGSTKELPVNHQG